MKVALIGAEGQLGMDVQLAFEEAGHDLIPLTHARIELASAESIRNALAAVAPELVVNTAARHHVERCEEEPEAAYAVNAIGPRNLARWCEEAGAALMHVSTDYVFDGRRRTPYEEADEALPLNVYGNTKLAGERFVQAVTDRYFILRTSGLYGSHPCREKGANFVDKMIELAGKRPQLRVVDDEVLTPTSTRELARQMVALAGTEAFGLYHATAEGDCSWYAFAREIFDRAGVETDLQPARPGEFPAKVPRPTYSVLENRLLKQRGLNRFRGWREGLREYLEAGRPVAVAK